jgi:hypothetical protein
MRIDPFLLKPVLYKVYRVRSGGYSIRIRERDGDRVPPGPARAPARSFSIRRWTLVVAGLRGRRTTRRATPGWRPDRTERNRERDTIEFYQIPILFDVGPVPLPSDR